jgi:hypothetical protein
MNQNGSISSILTRLSRKKQNETDNAIETMAAVGRWRQNGPKCGAIHNTPRSLNVSSPLLKAMF